MLSDSHSPQQLLLPFTSAIAAAFQHQWYEGLGWLNSTGLHKGFEWTPAKTTRRVVHALPQSSDIWRGGCGKRNDNNNMCLSFPHNPWTHSLNRRQTSVEHVLNVSFITRLLKPHPHNLQCAVTLFANQTQAFRILINARGVYVRNVFSRVILGKQALIL